jgi:hypothetical protein
MKLWAGKQINSQAQLWQRSELLDIARQFVASLDSKAVNSPSIDWKGGYVYVEEVGN